MRPRQLAALLRSPRLRQVDDASAHRRARDGFRGNDPAVGGTDVATLLTARRSVSVVFQSHLSFPVCRSRNKNWRRQFKTHKPEISPRLQWPHSYVGCYCDRQPPTLTVKHASSVYADTITCSGQNEHPRRSRRARGDRQPEPNGLCPVALCFKRRPLRYCPFREVCRA